MEAYCLFVFDSTHAAIAGQKCLSGQVRAVVMPTLREISASCGISLRVAPEDALRARRLLPEGSYRLYRVEAGRPTAME